MKAETIGARFNLTFTVQPSFLRQGRMKTYERMGNLQEGKIMKEREDNTGRYNTVGMGR